MRMRSNQLRAMFAKLHQSVHGWRGEKVGIGGPIKAYHLPDVGKSATEILGARNRYTLASYLRSNPAHAKNKAIRAHAAKVFGLQSSRGMSVEDLVTGLEKSGWDFHNYPSYRWKQDRKKLRTIATELKRRGLTADVD